MTNEKGGFLNILLENNQQNIQLETSERKKSETSFGKNTGYFYEDPVQIIEVTKADGIAEGLDLLEKMQADGYHLAGWISYEVGLYLESHLRSKLNNKRMDMAYIYMGVYKNRKILNADEVEDFFKEAGRRQAYQIQNLKINTTRAEYDADIATIHEYLGAGDIYQVNYTVSCDFDVKGRSIDLYAALRKAQKVEYSAYIMGHDFRVLSLSPELFIEKKGNRLKVRPMKGTTARGRDYAEDILKSNELRASEKNCAENLMIVDLLRNDLSKIAAPGSVEVKSIFQVEKYRTLFTMTSQIEADLAAGVSFKTMITSLFPCGSVTGAPKIRAMEIIDQLEKTSRGVYCGAIGYLTPEGDMCFSVPIRTIYLQKDEGIYHAKMGIGGAIVADSSAESEYEESLLKAKFLTNEYQDFDLIETFLFSKNVSQVREAWEGEYQNLTLHLKRLEQSAEYFDFSFNLAEILETLEEHAQWLKTPPYCGSDRRVRLLLSPKGHISLTSTKIHSDPSKTIKIMVSDKRVQSDSILLFHKVTARDFFNEALLEAKGKGCDEVIFLNEKKQLTEGTYSNVFLEINGKLFTPKTTSGLLSGILRQKLIASGRAQEKDLNLEDLKSADKIFIGNSLRGLLAVELIK